MAYRDLRQFIEVLEKEEELLRIPVEVDWRYEVAGWIRRSQGGDRRRLRCLGGEIAGFAESLKFCVVK